MHSPNSEKVILLLNGVSISQRKQSLRRVASPYKQGQERDGALGGAVSFKESPGSFVGCFVNEKLGASERFEFLCAVLSG